MIFETKANLRPDQIEDIKNSLSQILLEDFQIVMNSNRIAWFTDEENKEVKQ